MDDVRLVLTCGLPGAGKTTLAKRLTASRGAVRLTKDDWLWALGSSPWDRGTGERLEAELWRLTQDLLRHGVSVVLDFGLWARAERDELRTGARRLGAKVELHDVDAPDEELWHRIEQRNSAPPWNDQPIGRHHLDEWRARFEAPDPEELALFDLPEPRALEKRGRARPTLVLFCGLPGAGKTTLAKDLAAAGRGLRICTDDWQASLGVDLDDEEFHERLQLRLYQLALDLLDTGLDVILEDGLWTKTERDRKLADARHHGADTELHVFDLTFEQLWARIEHRNRHGPTEAVRIDRASFERIWDRFEPPDRLELEQFGAYEIHGESAQPAT